MTVLHHAHIVEGKETTMLESASMASSLQICGIELVIGIILLAGYVAWRASDKRKRK